MLECDTQAGFCSVAETGPNEEKILEKPATPEVFYIGDPMCSWCWGLSEVTKKVEAHCAAQGLSFRIVMGGLRPGGGDAWNHGFRAFLRNEWEHIAARTGQPFGYTLLSLSHFEYDTEPACRAVVTARRLLDQDEDQERKLLNFFSSVQHRFYVDGEDPKKVDFFVPILKEIGLSVEQFSEEFSSHRARLEVLQDFRIARQLGVRAFPSIVARKGDTVFNVAAGYADFDVIKHRLLEIHPQG